MKGRTHRGSFQLFCIGFFFLFYNIFGVCLFAQPLKEKVAHLINDTIVEVLPSGNRIWAVVGVNRQKIVCVKKEHFIREYLFNKEPSPVYVTALFLLENGAVLVGTKSNYLYYLHGRTAVRVDQNNGLRDSTILKIFTNKQTKKIEFSTPNGIYCISNATSSRRIKCELKNEETDFFESVKAIIRQKIRKPIQKEISTIASELDFSGRKKKYFNPNALDSVVNMIKPGDVFLKRDDSYLSNIGIEGFWTHSAIYIGSLELLDSLFGAISCIEKIAPSRYLETHFPLVYMAMAGKKNLILEAVGSGVSINPIEHILFVDYVSVLRPNLSENDIFKSMLISFEYLGVPYDFLFDFRTDNELVCSELIYRSYRPLSDKGGISFVFGEVMGLPFLSPNDIAHQFADEFDKPNPSFSFVLFADYSETKKSSFFSNSLSFCQSWKR